MDDRTSAPDVVAMRPFVPAKDFDTSQRFYTDAPTLQPWGLVVAYVWDPSGVLWHIAEERR
jgi:hypothetical protein